MFRGSLGENFLKNMDVYPVQKSRRDFLNLSNLSGFQVRVENKKPGIPKYTGFGYVNACLLKALTSLKCPSRPNHYLHSSRPKHHLSHILYYRAQQC